MAAGVTEGQMPRSEKGGHQGQRGIDARAREGQTLGSEGADARVREGWMLGPERDGCQGSEKGQMLGSERDGRSQRGTDGVREG